jgi:hypothetical protein
VSAQAAARTPGPWEVVVDASSVYFRCSIIARAPSQAMQNWRSQKLHEWAPTEIERELGTFGTTTICDGIGQKFNGSGPRCGPKITLDAAEAKANAAFIVQACNAHGDLVAAVRSAVAVLSRSEAEARRKNLPHGIGDAIVYLTSALAKAGAL